MVRGLLKKIASKSLSVARKWQQHQLRRLNIHEYQGAELMAKHGINVPPGIAFSSVEEIRKLIQDVFPKENELVVKSQILAGGRGLGTFKNGFQGGVHIVKAAEVEETAEEETIFKALSKTMELLQGNTAPISQCYYGCLFNELLTFQLPDRHPPVERFELLEGSKCEEQLNTYVKCEETLLTGLTYMIKCEVVRGFHFDLKRRNASTELLPLQHHLTKEDIPPCYS